MPLPCGSELPQTPDRGTATAAFAARGTFVYCNNPEVLTPADLGDHAPGYGNRYLLWSQVAGPCRAYYAHRNDTGHPIGYGLLAWNPGPAPVWVAVTRSGFGTDPFTCWQQFYAGTAGAPAGAPAMGSGAGGSGPFPVPANANTLPVGAFSLAPGELRWLQRHEGVPAGAAFQGIVAFAVVGGPIYLFHYAYRHLAALDGTATYLGFVTRTGPGAHREARVYKGTAVGAVVAAALAVPVSALLRAPLTWRTHGCRDKWPDAVEADMLSIVCPLGPPAAPRFITFSCARGDNLGNWGVEYAYHLRLTNDTSRPVRVSLAVAQPTHYSHVFAITPDGMAGCTLYRRSWRFYDVPLAPGEDRAVPYRLVLSGGSVGGIVNAIVAGAVRECSETGTRAGAGGGSWVKFGRVPGQGLGPGDADR